MTSGDTTLKRVLKIISRKLCALSLVEEDFGLVHEIPFSKICLMQTECIF